MPLKASFAATHFMPEAMDARSSYRSPHVAWAIALIPQRPGQSPSERPWTSFVPIREDLPSLPQRPDYQAGAHWFSYVLGWFGGSPISLLLVPLVFLSGILMVHTRPGGLALVATASTLLLVFIWADARRIQKELRISSDPAYPAYQRDLARAKASTSFFHKTAPPTKP